METEATFNYCLGCLSHKDDKQAESYSIQSEAMKEILQVNKVMLCYICTKLAIKSEKFIQNVQRNQKYLENFKNIADSFETRHNIQQLVNLSAVSLHSIELTSDNVDLEMPIFNVHSSHANEVEVKLELKEELSLEFLDHDFMDDTDFQESSVKEECLLDNFKEEDGQILDNISLKQLKKALKAGKPKKKTKLTNKENQRVKDKKENIKQKQKLLSDSVIQKLNITLEQCMKDRKKMREDPKYKNLNFKCADCIKGFNFKESYEKHMELHSKVKGEFECDVCKRRMNTLHKLLEHKKYHQIRYKCGECGLIRLNRFTIKDHYTAVHLPETNQYKCSHCTKLFNRQVSLRKHLAYVHRSKKRIECKYCLKTFAHKEGLKGHIMLKHPTESAGQSFTQHVCKECGAGFKNPSQLKNHMTKHSDKRDFYCVECDKAFKSSHALTQHLKIAAPHVNYLELKLQCEHCDKRFGVKRELERHLNRVHLNRRPHQCDKCDKAYVSLWTLTEHKKFAHEGHKRPLKYPCPQCDKVFAQNSTLKSHIRTHTGERPYACTECPAAFSQGSILRTHVKLVHLRLTRDGLPKRHPAVTAAVSS